MKHLGFPELVEDLEGLTGAPFYFRQDVKMR